MPIVVPQGNIVFYKRIILPSFRPSLYYNCQKEVTPPSLHFFETYETSTFCFLQKTSLNRHTLIRTKRASKSEHKFL